MSDLSFDRDRAGITAKGHWTDSETFISIGFGYAELEASVTSSKTPSLRIRSICSRHVCISSS